MDLNGLRVLKYRAHDRVTTEGTPIWNRARERATIGRGAHDKLKMFSPALEIVLTVAYREATARRHTHLTLEHLLYALAHDPDGERILTRLRRRHAAAAARSRQVPAGLGRAVRARPAEGARADAGVPPRAPDGGPARPERRPPGSAFRRRHRGDPAAEPVARGAAARRRRASPGSTSSSTSPTARPKCRRHRLAVRTPSESGADAEAGGRRARRRDSARSAVRLRHRPDGPRQGRRARPADRPDRRAPADDGDPLPAAQEQSGVRRRRRRRQDGAGRRPRHAAARGRRPGSARGRRGLLARHRRAPRRHAVPRRLRRALQGRHPCARRSVRCRSSSSTRFTRRSAPARRPAARWIWRRSSSQS